MEFNETTNGRIRKSFKGDCVVRSISLAMGKTYKEVFEDLMALGLKMGAYPNHDAVWKKYLKENGWVANKPPRNLAGKMIKLRDWGFAGTAIVKNSRHLTCVIEGDLFDTWDCRYRPVNTYWTKAAA